MKGTVFGHAGHQRLEVARVEGGHQPLHRGRAAMGEGVVHDLDLKEGKRRGGGCVGEVVFHPHAPRIGHAARQLRPGLIAAGQIQLQGPIGQGHDHIVMSVAVPARLAPPAQSAIR